MTAKQDKPSLYLSLPHECGYLPERQATTLFLDPDHVLQRQRYDDFVRAGFRRSGNLVYRPHCQTCQSCVAVRIPVERFQPNRGQRRIWQRNQDLAIDDLSPAFDDEHFQLYRRYLATRHAGGGMDDPTPDKYLDFLVSRHTRTVFHEMRLGGQLMAVAVTDHLGDGLSAVYTFYEPQERRRGLGVFSVLWQVELARVLGLKYVYLGYWISNCDKMAYKTAYRPLEALIDGDWQEMSLPL